MAKTLVNNPTTVKNYGNSGNAYTFTQEVIQNATGDPATNKTSITVNLYIQGINGYSYNGFTTPKAAIYIQGTKMKEVVVGAVTTSKVKYCSIDYDLPHLDDGTQTLKVKTTYNPNTTSYSFLPASYTYESTTTMTAIPRKSTMSLSSTSITTLGSTTATITTRNRNFTHTITTYYNGLYTLASDKTGASPTATITIPAGLRQRMAQNGVSSATLTLSLNTYNGSTLLGTNDYSLSVSAPDPVITVSPASVRCNSATTQWVLTNYDTYLLNYAVTRTCGSKSYTDLARTEGFISTRSNLANVLFEQALPNNTKGTVTVSVTSYIKNTSTAVKTVTKTYEVTIPTGTYKPTIALVTGLAARQITVHGTRSGIAYFAGLDGASGVVSESINGSSRIDTRSVTISYNGINSTETVGEYSVSGSNVTIYASGSTKAWPASASNYTATVTYTVTDKRGTPASYSFTAVTVSGYFRPVINASVERATSSGVTDPEGTSANVTVAASTAVSTGGTIKKIEAKVEGTTLIASSSYSDTLYARPATGTYLTNTEYSIDIIATDNINLTTTVTVILPKIAVALSLHKNIGVGLGTIATQGRITNGLPLYLKDPVYINHQGDVKGSSNFDGHTNITENLWIPYSTVRRNNANNTTYVYHRIATIGEITGSWYDASGIILIDQGYDGGGWGIARLILRTNNVSQSQAPSARVEWLVRSRSLSANCLQWGLYNNSGKATADVYYYATGSYDSCVIRKLESYRGSISCDRWILVNSTATGSGATSEDTVKTEVYTGLNRIEYTSTGVAAENGVVAGLRSSTVGGSSRPIYLNSGTATQVDIPESGSWWKGVPTVLTDGVMEIGKYLDFHNTNAATTDNDGRIYTDGTRLISSKEFRARSFTKEYYGTYYPRRWCQGTSTSANKTTVASNWYYVPLTTTEAENPVIDSSSNKLFKKRNGGIQVLRAGKYKVSASVYIGTSSGGRAGAYIFDSTAAFADGSSVPSTSTELIGNALYGNGTDVVITIAPKIVTLAANHIVHIVGRTMSAAGTVYCSNKSTYLLVEWVSD